MDKIQQPTAWYGLKLGEHFHPNGYSSVTRVPGGWIFGNMQGACFIPWDNEFQSNSEQSMTIKQIGMGVSQWKEHGKTHGYWDYFVEVERTRLKKELRDKAKNSSIGMAVSTVIIDSILTKQSMKTVEDLKNMEFGEEFMLNHPNNNIRPFLIRVPNGWVYHSGPLDAPMCCFIPERLWPNRV